MGPRQPLYPHHFLTRRIHNTHVTFWPILPTLPTHLHYSRHSRYLEDALYHIKIINRFKGLLPKQI